MWSKLHQASRKKDFRLAFVADNVMEGSSSDFRQLESLVSTLGTWR
jgi:hypothetical protein